MGNRNLELIDNLNHSNVDIRLESLNRLIEDIKGGNAPTPPRGQDVNNHIHTTYSFSPYSPTKAIWMAYNAGLTTAGIMDHDSIAGAREFIEAGKIAGIKTTIGVECRVDFSSTPLKGRRINNPDQLSNAYMAIHGIPHNNIDRVGEFFIPISRARNIRNEKMVARINEIFSPFGIALDFKGDVMSISNSQAGGSITERHILFALSKELIGRWGKGEGLLDFLGKRLGLSIDSKVYEYLLDSENPHYTYDLLGLLKRDLTGRIYIDATDECKDVKEVVEFAKSIGAISAYAYLGDVEESITGDKKAQEFEDGYLRLLFETIKEIGFNAVTYMPSRNTRDQLRRVKGLCDEFELLEISGEDINSPRQSFICEALREAEFKNLIDSTWALIGHETVATENIHRSLFSKETVDRYPDLDRRIQIYSDIGKRG